MKAIWLLILFVFTLFAATVSTPPLINEEISATQIQDIEYGSYFGTSTSISGDTAIVGSWESDNNDPGSAYIFQKQSDGSLTQTAVLTANDREVDDAFGTSVSIYGDTAIIGARGDDINDTSNVGSAYIFQKDSDGNWNQVAKLTADDEVEDGFFGNSVSIYKDTAIVGAIYYGDYPDTHAGNAYIFQKQSDGSWIQTAKLTAE